MCMHGPLHDYMTVVYARMTVESNAKKNQLALTDEGVNPRVIIATAGIANRDRAVFGHFTVN